MDKWLKQSLNKNSENCDNIPSRNNSEGCLKKLDLEKNAEQLNAGKCVTEEVVKNAPKKF